MKPFGKTTMLRPLTSAELCLEDPEWDDEDTVSFYIPCWFDVDSVFSGIHVETFENDDFINLYCIYNTKLQSVRLLIIYANNSGTAGEEDFEVAVEMDPDTEAMLLEKAAAWLMKAQSQQSH